MTESEQDPASFAEPLFEFPREDSKIELPSFTTPLIGRDSELAELQQIVSESDPSVITLVGPPGVGKTRLLAALMERLGSKPSGFDGIWATDVRNARSLRYFVVRLSELFELPLQGLDSPADAVDLIGEWLCNARPLIGLDNLEQGAEAAARVIGGILQQGGLSTFICTSRQPLDIDREKVFSVEPLDGETALELYLESIGVQVDSLDVSRQQLLALVNELGGIPLSVELAAGRYPVLTPDDIAERTEEQLEVLQRPDEWGEWESTLADSIERSWNLLESSHHEVLRAAALFESPWTVSAIAKICDSFEDKETLRQTVDDLLDHSLIHRTNHSGAERYQLFSMVKEFATGLPDRRGLEATLIRNFVNYWTAQMERFSEKLNSRQVERAQEAFLEQQQNIFAAFEFAEDYAPEQALELAEAISLFRYYTPLQIGAQTLFERASDLTVENAGEREKRLQVRLEYRHKRTKWHEWDTDRVKGAFEDSVRDARRVGDSFTESAALESLAGHHRIEGDYEKARQSVREALEVADPEDYQRRASLLCADATTASHEGREAEAVERLEEALELLEKAPDSRTESFVLSGLADTMLAVGQTQKAREYLDKADRAARFSDDVLVYKYVLKATRAQVDIVEGKFETAIERAEASMELCEKLQRDWHTGLILTVKAVAQIGNGQLLKAKAALDEATVRNERYDTPYFQTFSYGWAAILRWLAGEESTAEKNLEKSLENAPPEEAFPEVLKIWRQAMEHKYRAADERDLDELESLRQQLGPYRAPELETDCPSSFHLLVASQMLTREIERMQLTGSDETNRVFIDLEDFEAFRLQGENTVSLGHSDRLQSLLQVLAQAHSKGEHLDTHTLFERAWPSGEQADPERASGRVYQAIRTLRESGLEPVLFRDDRGYYLSPEISIEEIG